MGKAKQIDWLTTDKQPEQDYRRTPELSEWPPDTRGVSQAHYYNGTSHFSGKKSLQTIF
jgi:hypothetical protein